MSEQKYLECVLPFLNDLRQRSPAPGGGSVAALLLCLGAGLVEKALRYSASREQSYADELALLSSLRERVAGHIDLDGKVFAEVMSLRGDARKGAAERCQGIVLTTGRACTALHALVKKSESGIKKSIYSDFVLGDQCARLALRACLNNLEANEHLFGVTGEESAVFAAELERWEES
ncbi:MAG: hypothetical protein GF333_06110 [Candidatus Omnitrophica bacterium]|nr:hypothetical protein [Candidatus Omnitrophota bacterium]